MPAPMNYPDRQRHLFVRLLLAMRAQRACLISGNAARLEQANRAVSRLLDKQQRLSREAGDLAVAPDPDTMAELRRLAADLRQESHINYLLACRGLQYTDFRVSLLTGDQEGDNGAALSREFETRMLASSASARPDVTRIRSPRYCARGYGLIPE